MKMKNKRLDAIKAIVSGKQMGSQAEILAELKKEGFNVTQATLSRDMKLLKVAKTSTMSGQYIYKMPNETMFRRVHEPSGAKDMASSAGFFSVRFSGNLAIIRTRPAYASSIAYNIDDADIPGIMGTVAGNDTVFVALEENVDQESIYRTINEMFGY